MKARAVQIDDDDVDTFLSFSRCETKEDLATIAAIEARSYPADEMASAESLAMRAANAGDFFMVARLKKTAAGADADVDENHMVARLKKNAAGADADVDENPIVAYVCGTLARGETLTGETMTTHDPSGTTLCVHSVCVSPEHRRRGFGAAALSNYVREWIVNHRGGDATRAVKSIRLLCKENLIAFYANHGGFELIGPSDVVHGADLWYDMKFDVVKPG